MAAATHTAAMTGSRGDVILADISNFLDAKERMPPQYLRYLRVWIMQAAELTQI